jgi:hypothetical protein
MLEHGMSCPSADTESEVLASVKSKALT